MGKQMVTIFEMIDLAIGTPESAVNFNILNTVLKLMARHCCKMHFKFELNMDDTKAEPTPLRNDSSSFDGSFDSRANADDSSLAITEKGEGGQSDDGKSEAGKSEAGKSDAGKNEVEKTVEVKKESTGEQKEENKKEGDKGKSEGKADNSGDDKKHSKKESPGATGNEVSKKDSSKKNKRRSSEKIQKKDSDGHKQKDSDGHKRRDSDSTKHKIQQLEHRYNESENQTKDLNNQLKEMADRVENILQTISTHLDDKHLAEINDQIGKLKKDMESATDQCFEVNNSMNEQSSQIQQILAAIDNIQLKKVENEELIDLLSGKADHSFVNEKVSSAQFEEIIQELKDIINENISQIDTAKMETNASLDEIKQELFTKLMAEEFDAAKTKIYRELIKLTEQVELILAQQNEHVAAGAKLRNLNCFACDNEVVMLLEEEIIPKFRGLKSTLQPLEPLVGSKINVGNNSAEWKDHQLKTKDFTKNSKASRVNPIAYEKPNYVQGRNGYMYKGNVGCDCVEGMNALKRSKNGNCCSTVQAKNIKNASKIKSTSKVIVKSENNSNGIIGGIIQSAPIAAAVQKEIPETIQESPVIEELKDGQTAIDVEMIKKEPTEAEPVEPIVAEPVEPIVAEPVEPIVVEETIIPIEEVKNEVESELPVNNDEVPNMPDVTNATPENNEEIVNTEA